MADFLPPAVQKFIADTREYNEPVNESAERTKKFGRAAEEASITAKRAMNNAAEAARKLAVAEDEAAVAAEKLKRNEIDEAKAAEIAARATNAKVKADLAARESALAAANAADKEADNFRQVARDAALMEAATFLANSRSEGSVRSNRKEIQALSKTFPELKKDAEAALNSVESSFKGVVENAMQLKVVVIPAILGGLLQLPAVSAVVGGGLTAAVGGAFAAIGLKATAGTEAGKAALNDLKTHAKSAAREISKPFEDTWANIDVGAREAFRSVEPELKDLLAKEAQTTSLFVRQVGSSFGELRPMLSSLGDAYQRVVGDLGDRMPSIMHNVATGFKAVFDAAAENPEALSNFVEDLALITRGAGDTIGALTRMQQRMSWLITPSSGLIGSFLSLAKAAGWTKEKQADLAGSSITLADKMRNTTKDSNNLVDSFDAQRLSVDNLKTAFDRYTGANQSAAIAEINMQQAIDDTTAAIRHNGQTIDTNTQKGRDNYKQLVETAKAFQDKIVAMKNDGATADQVSQAMGALKDTFYKLALQMTGSSKTARELTTKLLGVGDAARGVPGRLPGPKFQDNTYTVRQHIADLQRSITALHGKTVTIKYIEQVHRTLQAERARAEGGPVFGYADGGEPQGLVRGPGSERSDSIPVRVSNGEYVVNAEQTRKYYDVLQAINYGLDGFAAGGFPHKVSLSKHAKHANFTANSSADWAASHAASSRLGAYRRSSESAWMTMGGVGSGHGVIVQHVTNITVQGSLLTERQLHDSIQEGNLQRNLRNPTSGVSLQSGRIGG